MAKISWRGGALLAPVPPVLVSTGTIEKPNVCTVAWAGILNTRPPKTYISLRPGRFSYELIQQNGEFVLNLPASSIIRSIDYCGVKSGRNENKLEACSLTAEPSVHVQPPQIAESPVAIECRVFQQTELGSHIMLLADIVGVSVEESLLDEKGKLHLERAGLAAYAHGDYFALGKKIGSFGYSVRKRRKRHAPGKKQKN